MLKKFSVPALSFFLRQHLFFLFLFQQLPFLSLLFRLPFLSFFSVPFSLFFFLPYLFKVQPFTCCSLTQPKKPKRFSAFQPKRFCFNSATLSSCFFLLYSFLVQPKNVTFSPKRFFFFFSLGCPLFFSPSVQFKTFFSCFMSLYLSKSSFSSNLK